MSTENEILAFCDLFREERNFEKANTFILQSEAQLPGMLALMQREKYPYSEHISWMLMHFSAKYPPLLFPFVPQLLQILSQTNNGTLRRNLLSVFLNLPPLQVQSEWFDRLLEFIRNPDTKPAVKVNALKLSEHWFLHTWPELADEVREVLSLYAADERPSIRIMLRTFHKKYGYRRSP